MPSTYWRGSFKLRQMRKIKQYNKTVSRLQHKESIISFCKFDTLITLITLITFFKFNKRTCYSSHCGDHMSEEFLKKTLYYFKNYITESQLQKYDLYDNKNNYSRSKNFIQRNCFDKTLNYDITKLNCVKISELKRKNQRSVKNQKKFQSYVSDRQSKN
jgi:hypothetical protein